MSISRWRRIGRLGTPFAPVSWSVRWRPRVGAGGVYEVYEVDRAAGAGGQPGRVVTLDAPGGLTEPEQAGVDGDRVGVDGRPTEHQPQVGAAVPVGGANHTSCSVDWKAKKF
jgi:hypothetical protein